MSEAKTVKVSETTWKKLQLIKIEQKAKNMDEVIRNTLKEEAEA